MTTRSPLFTVPCHILQSLQPTGCICSNMLERQEAVEGSNTRAYLPPENKQPNKLQRHGYE